MSRRRNRRPAQQRAQDTLPGTDQAGTITNHTGQSAPTEPTMNGVEHSQEPDHGPVVGAPGTESSPVGPTPQAGAQAAQVDDHGQGHGQVWSASEAARRCGIPRTSLTRMLQRGEMPGAGKDADGHWQVPLSGLLAAGLTPTAPSLETKSDAQEPEDPTMAEELVVAREEIARLRVQLAEAEGRARAAEQVAEERAARLDDQAAYIHDLRGPIFRALEQGQTVQPDTSQVNRPAHPVQSAPITPESTQSEGMARRISRWWRGQ